MNIKLIRAFIASPGGLEAERRAAFDVAEEVNRSVARHLGGRFELIGWEETLSGVGRPQAIINAEMESCDLFIGAMWRTWGSSPSLEGLYTSGFEEEFELSRARHARTQRPIMAMFFKDVDPLQIRDAGEELKKVLSFQEKLRAEKSFLYGTFGTAEEFAAKVREFFSAHTIRILKETEAPREERPAQPEADNECSARERDTLSQRRAQEADFLLVTSKALRSEEGPSPAEVARLRLVAAEAGTSGNDKLVLGVHDSNLLYVHRKEFTFSFHEKRRLLQSDLTQIDHENVPVWSRLAELARGMPSLLVALTVVGEDAERVGALTAMRLLGEPIQQPPFLQSGLVEDYWLESGTAATVKVAALRYLREHGSQAHLAAIITEADIAANDTVALAHEAAVSILLRENPQEAIRHLLSISFETFDSALLHQTLAYLGELGSEALERGLDHRSPYVRAQTLRILSERNALDLETIGRAREDDAAVVRLAAVRAMERSGQPVSLNEAYVTLSRPRRSTGPLFYLGDTDSAGVKLFQSYRAEQLRHMPIQLLEALLGTSEHRDAAYQALAERRIGDFGNQLRTDLRDDFQAYFSRHWPEGIKSALGRGVSLLTIGIWDPADAKRRELVCNALDVIAAQRDEADLALVRDVLDRNFVTPTATVIAYLKALGGPKDVARLARTSPFPQDWPADGSYQSDFDKAARTILSVHVGGLEKLIGQPMPEAMRARLVDLAPLGEFAKLDNREIVRLLLSKDNLVRRAVAKKTSCSLARSRITKILAAYKGDGEGRYYIVTHWLDLGLAYSRPVARRVAVNKQ